MTTGLEQLIAASSGLASLFEDDALGLAEVRSLQADIQRQAEHYRSIASKLSEYENAAAEARKHLRYASALEVPDHIGQVVRAAQEQSQVLQTAMDRALAVKIHEEFRKQLEQIDAFRAGWAEAEWSWTPQVSVSRSIVPLVDDISRAYFGRDRRGGEGVGMLDGVSARFGPSFVGEPDELVERLAHDVALDAADMVLITVPNLLGVDFNARLLEGAYQIGKELGWND